MNDLVARIGSFPSVENWDSYGGKPITKEARDKAISLIQGIHAVPLADGGIRITLGNDEEVIIKVWPNGFISESNKCPDIADDREIESRKELEKVIADIILDFMTDDCTSCPLNNVCKRFTDEACADYQAERVYDLVLNQLKPKLKDA